MNTALRFRVAPDKFRQNRHVVVDDLHKEIAGIASNEQLAAQICRQLNERMPLAVEAA